MQAERHHILQIPPDRIPALKHAVRRQANRSRCGGASHHRRAAGKLVDEDLNALMQLIAARRLSPVIDKVLPLEEAREGLRLIESREVIGKVVVVP